MNLLRVACYGVAGVPDADLSLCDASGHALDFVAIVGPTGSGKTRLIEAIIAAKEALASSGAPIQPSSWVREDGAAARIALTWSFDDEERMYGGLDGSSVETEVLFTHGPAPETEEDDLASIVLARYGQRGTSPGIFGVSGKVEYFPAGRAIELVQRTGLDEGTQRPLRSTRDRRKYGFIPQLLRELPLLPACADFETLLARFAPTCRFDREAAARGERCFAGARGERAHVDELSSTEAEAVLVAATTVAMGLDPSLLLVDRPERGAMGRPPSDCIQAWRAVGRGTQVIAATGWEAMARSLPSEHVKVLAA